MKIDHRVIAFVVPIAALVLACDQYTKHLVCMHIPLFGKIEILPGVLDLVHIRNTGIAFGLLQNIGSAYRTAVMFGVGAVALVLLGVLTAHVTWTQKLQVVALSLIFGGAVGNLIDRIRFGEVVDFIDVHWRNLYHWPAFNVADSAISIGIAFVVIDELVLKKRKKG
ncbi:MAG: signal peptidase II [Desulfobacterota bacterium]|nr:signal peptidase II [Thermodesulfobacteriota bacterium]